MTTPPTTHADRLRTDQLDYELPPQRIAVRPAQPRDAARLLVYRRGEDAVEHRRVRDLPELLEPGDALILNDTAVARARLAGRRPSGGRVEGLFLETRDDGRWTLMLRANGRLRPGDRIELLDRGGGPAGHALELVDRRGPHWTATVHPPTPQDTLLERVGRTPVPPYILRARGRVEVDDDLDRSWYQTVFAADPRRRSVAAPTAGLHFTTRLLERLEALHVRRHAVTLHVGPGTFAPITASSVDAHDMHAEWFEVPPAVLEVLEARTRSSFSGRLVAVGTTVVRSLESLPEPLPPADAPIGGETRLLISPPYRFRHVDALLTNFHLPRSTLLALVAAMIGLPRLLSLYREAIDREYRFYSYGDAMLILP